MACICSNVKVMSLFCNDVLLPSWGKLAVAEVLLVIWTQRSRKPSDREISVQSARGQMGRDSGEWEKSRVGLGLRLEGKSCAGENWKSSGQTLIPTNPFEGNTRGFVPVCMVWIFWGGEGGKWGARSFSVAFLSRPFCFVSMFQWQVCELCRVFNFTPSPFKT